MSSLGPEHSEAALKQLEQAIYNHEQWHKDLTRTIICQLPYDHHDVAEDAHRQCRFGQWYYGNTSEEVRGHAAFVAIAVEHKRMHQLARQLLQVSASEVPVSHVDYDTFANSLERLRLQIYTLKRELEESLLNRDSLTGAENRISMLTRQRELLQLVRRNVQRCCIAVMDLDRFKTINDTYGHLTGDRVLSASVRYIREGLRPYDRVFRYGGDEFLISLPNTDLEAAQAVIERVRGGLAANAVAHEGPEPIFTTASFGIALLDANVGVEESIDRADKAMYAAKAAGRNRSQVWDPSMVTDPTPTPEKLPGNV